MPLIQEIYSAFLRDVFFSQLYLYFLTIYSCVSAPRLCGYFFQQKSSSQTITYRLSSSKHKKKGTVYIQCRFILCQLNDTEPLCIFGCRPNRKLKVNETRSVTVKVGPFSAKEAALAVERKG